jgi:anti-sigma factor RsiW
MSAEHTDIGAYSLGLLNELDRLAFEDHLATCPTCGAELDDLSGMKELLSGIEPVGPPASPETATGPQVIDLLSRRAAAQRRRSRWQVAAGAAAGVVLLAGGGVAGVAAASQSSPTSAVALPTGQQHHAVDAATGTTGTVGLVSEGWGTQVVLDLAKVRGPLECELIAVSKTGEQRVVVGWHVPPAGYGVPAHPAHLLVEGGTSIPRSDLAAVIVKVVHGRTLVHIPV